MWIFYKWPIFRRVRIFFVQTLIDNSEIFKSGNLIEERRPLKNERCMNKGIPYISEQLIEKKPSNIVRVYCRIFDLFANFLHISSIFLNSSVMPLNK